MIFLYFSRERAKRECLAGPWERIERLIQNIDVKSWRRKWRERERLGVREKEKV